jgi:hypothetical protein
MPIEVLILSRTLPSAQFRSYAPICVMFSIQPATEHNSRSHSPKLFWSCLNHAALDRQVQQLQLRLYTYH